MYRIWDVDNEMWLNQDPDDINFYLVSPDEQVVYCECQSKRKKTYKILTVDQEKYVYHKSTDLEDDEGYLIFEGDIVGVNGHVCIVFYLDKVAGYVLADLKNYDVYPIRPEVHQMHIIGNVLQDQEYLEEIVPNFGKDEEVTMNLYAEYYPIGDNKESGEKNERGS